VDAHPLWPKADIVHAERLSGYGWRSQRYLHGPSL